jgi:hypothetical protein
MKRPRRGPTAATSRRTAAAALSVSAALLYARTPYGPTNRHSRPQLFFDFFAEAASASPFPYREEQPDGRQTPSLHVVGGPRHHYEEDEAGFVVVSEEATDDYDDDDDEAKAEPFRQGLLASFGAGASGGLRAPTNQDGTVQDSAATSINKKRKKRKRRWKVYADVDRNTGALHSSHVRVGRANPRKAGLLSHLRPLGSQALRGEF